MVRCRSALAMVMAALSLSGCGDGGSDGSGGSTTPPGTSPSPTPTPAPTPTPTPTPPATVTPFESPLNILFIGGSITRGSNASAPENRYARRVESWLRTKFSTVNALNIGVGATNSQFAVHRYQRDAGDFRPDIAIIEFAVNDQDTSRAHFLSHTDALVYKIRQNNPQARIIYVAATRPAEEAARRSGSRDGRIDWAQEVMTANDSSMIDAGADIWRQVLAGQRVASDFFTDTVHPNDLGHAVYADAIQKALESILASGKAAPVSTSRYIAQTGYETARMIRRDEAVAATTCSPTSLSRKDAGSQSVSYFDQALACTTGQTITVRFTGTSIGIATLNDGSSNVLQCRMDGGASTAFNQPDTSWLYPQMLYQFLPDGSHQMTCEVQGRMTFGEILVNSSRRLTP